MGLLDPGSRAAAVVAEDPRRQPNRARGGSSAAMGQLLVPGATRSSLPAEIECAVRSPNERFQASIRIDAHAGSAGQLSTQRLPARPCGCAGRCLRSVVERGVGSTSEDLQSAVGVARYFGGAGYSTTQAGPS